jgi:CRISPR-associated Cas5-like protein
VVSPRTLEAISVQGFKCFDDLRLVLGDLSLMTGFNGGGKSTALQSLLLIAQTLREGRGSILPLNGPLVRLGTAGDIAPALSKRPMTFEASGEGSAITLSPTLQAGERNLPLATHGGLSVESELGALLAQLTYLAAVRIGAEDAYPIPENTQWRDMGHDGRFAPYWFEQLVLEDVDPRRCFPDLDGNFRKQVDAWLGYLFPGAEANVQNVAALSQMSLQFRLSELGSWRRPSNIGYGLTYAFPVIVALLAAPPNGLVVIDSPEAHLHPFGQSQMGRLLAKFAAAGVQIIVETHSDHLLNGARLAVRESVLPAKSLQIHFFHGATEDGHGVSQPGVGAGGEIYEWPKGFFDQGEKDLSLLAGWT